MSGQREELRGWLEAYYRGVGWTVSRHEDGTVRAAGIGGVTWIGLAVVPEDLGDPDFESLLTGLAEERMPRGERCTLELLPAAECVEGLRRVLDRLRLDRRGHVEVYSLAA